MEMYVISMHINGWSTFGVAHTSFALDMKSPTKISPPSNGSVNRISSVINIKSKLHINQWYEIVNSQIW